jgi:hypothetical protein
VGEEGKQHGPRLTAQHSAVPAHVGLFQAEAAPVHGESALTIIGAALLVDGRWARQ